MILRHILTGEKITVSRHLYDKQFRGAPHEWRDITPERTQKQVEAAERFIKLGKLYRTKSNLEDVIRTFGSHNGLFSDAVIALCALIKELI